MPSPTYVGSDRTTSNISPVVVYSTSTSTPTPTGNAVTYAVTYVPLAPTLATTYVIYIFNIKNHFHLLLLKL
jgi:hypothetical protein